MITVKVKRYDPELDKSYTESYEIEHTSKMKVLDALEQINDKYDAKIAYRYSCRAGQCGSCAIKVNGHAKLACKAEIHDNDLLEPLDFDVKKDLIVNRSPYTQKVRDLNLYVSSEDSIYTNKDPEVINPKTYENTDNLRRCIECFSCISMCPVIKETEAYVGPYYMRALTEISLDPREDTSHSEDAIDLGLYCCTSCGECSKTCPKDINIYGKAIEKLRERAYKEKVGPLEKHRKIKDMIMNTGRSVSFKSESDYPEGFIPEYNKTHKFEKKPNVALFTGCMVNSRLPWIAEYTVNILGKMGIEIDIPEGQICCGSPLIRTGQTDIIPTLVKKNYETFKDYDTVLTVCAGCGSTLKNNYPEYGADLNIMDITEFLEDKVKMEDTNKLDLKVTYHDPCHLVRGQDISSAPRNILRNLNGVEFIEMDKPDQCCGAGGGVKSGKPEIADALSDEKAEMIDKLDVDHVVTVCPFCEYNISDALKRNNSDTTIINLMELLNKAYQ